MGHFYKCHQICSILSSWAIFRAGLVRFQHYKSSAAGLAVKLDRIQTDECILLFYWYFPAITNTAILFLEATTSHVCSGAVMHSNLL